MGRVCLTFLYGVLCCGLYNSAAAWESEESYITKLKERKLELSGALDELDDSGITFTCRDLTIPASSNPIPLPQTVVTASQTSSSAGSVLSAVSGRGISAVHASRTMAVAKILACRNYTVYEGESLEWGDSPTQLALGKGLLRHEFGAITGNMGLIVISWAVLAEVAHWKGAATTHFPGTVVVPVLLLSTPTTTAATTIMRYGNSSYKTIGWGVIGLQVIGCGIISWLMWPSHFGSRFDTERADWIDKDISGYTKKYDMLFQDYRAGRNGYILIELSMNVASGMLAAYIPEQTQCTSLAWISTAIYGGYALVTISLMPHLEMIDKIYFCLLPVAQTVPLVITATSDIREESTTAQEVAATIPVVLYWVIIARSAYDVFVGVRALYKVYQKMRHPFSSDMLGGDDDDVQMQQLSNPLVGAGNT